MSKQKNMFSDLLTFLMCMLIAFELWRGHRKNEFRVKIRQFLSQVGAESFRVAFHDLFLFFRFNGTRSQPPHFIYCSTTSHSVRLHKIARDHGPRATHASDAMNSHFLQR